MFGKDLIPCLLMTQSVHQDSGCLQSHNSPTPETSDISKPGAYTLLPKQPQVFCPPECQLLLPRQVREYLNSDYTHCPQRGAVTGAYQWYTTGGSPAHANLAPLSGAWVPPLPFTLGVKCHITSPFFRASARSS